MKDDVMRKIVANTNKILLQKARDIIDSQNCNYIGVEREERICVNRDSTKLSCIMDYQLYPLGQSATEAEEFCSKPNRFVIDCKKMETWES